MSVCVCVCLCVFVGGFDVCEGGRVAYMREVLGSWGVRVQRFGCGVFSYSIDKKGVSWCLDQRERMREIEIVFRFMFVSVCALWVQ